MTGVSAGEVLGLLRRGRAKLPAGTSKRFIRRVDGVDLRAGKRLDELQAESTNASTAE